MEDTDVQLQIKKRARRRLVGAIAFVSVVAVVLPMVMDNQPKQHVQEVEIRIPGQDEKPFAPKFSSAPVAKAPELAVDKPDAVLPPAISQPALQPTARVIESSREKAAEKPADKSLLKPQDKPAETLPVKTEKNEKPVEKNVQKDADAKRAAAILTGQSDVPASKSGEYLVLIGAYANEANVKILKEKLSQEGIKTFTEPLNTPQGKKTRVRAGPFANREAAEKALVKMQAIGVPGVVSAK